MSYDDVIAKLRSVSLAGQPVRLVVARPVTEQETVDAPELNDVRILQCIPCSSVYNSILGSYMLA